MLQIYPVSYLNWSSFQNHHWWASLLYSSLSFLLNFRDSCERAPTAVYRKYYTPTSPIAFLAHAALADFRLAIANKDVKHDGMTSLDSSLPPLTSRISPLELNLWNAFAKNLFSPGLPSYLCDSRSTSAKQPKWFPQYHQSLRLPSLLIFPRAKQGCGDLVHLHPGFGRDSNRLWRSCAYDGHNWRCLWKMARIYELDSPV